MQVGEAGRQSALHCAWWNEGQFITGPSVPQNPSQPSAARAVPQAAATGTRFNIAAPPCPPQVPFIAQYRKELCGELLAVRYKDEPGTVDEGEANKDNPCGIIKV